MAFGIIRRIKIFQINVIISTDFSQQIYVNLPFWGSLNDLELPEFIILNFLKKKFLIHKIFNWVQGIRMCLMIIFQLTTHCFVTRAVIDICLFWNFPFQEFIEDDGQILTPIVVAARNGREKVVRLLLSNYKIDLEKRCVVKIDGHIVNGASALWCAAGSGWYFWKTSNFPSQSFGFKFCWTRFMQHICVNCAKSHK